MTGHGEKLSRLQDAAIAALLAEPTIAAAAARAGVADKTLWRWLQLPDFQAAYRAARRQVVEAAIAGLQQAAGEAVTTLRAVMADVLAPAGSRVAAARAVLDGALQGVELVELAERLDALETRLAAQQATEQRWRA